MATKNYTRITFHERLIIQRLNKQGNSCRSIAKILDRSPSSISEELNRWGMSSSTYSFQRAQTHANLMRKNRKPKEKMHGALEAIVQQLLTEVHCSPMQISKYLKKAYRELPELHVSHQTIYNYIHTSPKKNLLIKYLRRKGKKRRKKSTETKTRIKNLTSIHERPEEVETREVPGHWEGDLIVGKNNGSSIGTIVERCSRYTILVRTEKKESQMVVSAFSEEMGTLPAELLKSLTYDQGSEMAFHENLSRQLGINVYFADPGSPWQRPTNENTNGLLREFFPKKTDLNRVSFEELKRVQNLLNRRPRAVLGYATPAEAVDWVVQNPKKKFSEFIQRRE